MEETEIDEFGYAKRKPRTPIFDIHTFSPDTGPYSWQIQDRPRARVGSDDDGERIVTDEMGTYQVNVGVGFYHRLMELARQEYEQDTMTAIQQGDITFSEGLERLAPEKKKKPQAYSFEDYKPYKRKRFI